MTTQDLGNAHLKCRAPGLAERGECGEQAAVGIITEAIPDHVHDGLGDPDPILEIVPVCVNHAPEIVDEMVKTLDASEFAVVTLAYGQVGDLS